MQSYLILDFARCSRHAFEMYEQFALQCAHGKLSCVMFKTGAEDPDVHYALRDVLATVADVLSSPLDIRMALVPGSASAGRVYRSMLAELRALGCDVEIFRRESDAACWLCAAGDCPRAPAAAAVVAA